MMNISDLLGTMMQSGLSKSSVDRLRRSLSGGNDDTLRSLAGLSGKPAGGGGLIGSLAGMLGGEGGGPGGVLGSVMGDAGRGAAHATRPHRLAISSLDGPRVSRGHGPRRRRRSPPP